MRTSLIHHCKISIPSSAAYLGVTEGEIYSLFNNSPPELISLAELHRLAGQKIKHGDRDCLWFNGEAAQKDPTLTHTIEQLLDMINLCALPEATFQFEELQADFTQLIGLKPSIGTAIETLRIIVGKYEHLTGEISVFVEQLSLRGFFSIV
jgi:hypothetical protein